MTVFSCVNSLTASIAGNDKRRTVKVPLALVKPNGFNGLVSAPTAILYTAALGIPIVLTVGNFNSPCRRIRRKLTIRAFQVFIPATASIVPIGKPDFSFSVVGGACL